MNKALAASLALIAIMFLVSIYFYPLLPEKLASHWNEFGQADGYSGKLFGLLILPVVTLLIFLLMLAIPRIDPLKQNIKKFSWEYNGLILLFVLFFFALHAFLLAFNLGLRYDIRYVIVPGIALLFAYVGYILPKMKRNYMIGIRTPWTLASDKVWEKTHKAGAKAFYVVAIFFILAGLFPGFFWLLFLVPIIALLAFVSLYSYLEFRKEEKRKK